MRTRRLALVGLAALGLAACGGSDEESQPATTAPSGPAVLAKIPTGELSRPCAEIEGFGSLWVTNYGSGELVRIDPERNEAVDRVDVGATPCGLAVGAGSLWINAYGIDAVERVDPDTLEVVSIPVGTDPFDVLYAADSVWTTNVQDGTVSRIDPATNEVVANVEVGAQPCDGVVGPDGLVWIPNRGEGTISLIDPETNSVTDTIRVGATPFVLTVGFGDLWAASWGGGCLADPPRAAEGASPNACRKLDVRWLWLTNPSSWAGAETRVSGSASRSSATRSRSWFR